MVRTFSFDPDYSRTPRVVLPACPGDGELPCLPAGVPPPGTFCAALPSETGTCQAAIRKVLMVRCGGKMRRWFPEIREPSMEFPGRQRSPRSRIWRLAGAPVPLSKTASRRTRSWSRKAPVGPCCLVVSCSRAIFWAVPRARALVQVTGAASPFIAARREARRLRQRPKPVRSVRPRHGRDRHLDRRGRASPRGQPSPPLVLIQVASNSSTMRRTPSGIPRR